MKKYITAFEMTQSMFLSLPFPCREWDEKCRPYMLIFLPVIGLEIGILWAGIHYLLKYFNLPSAVYGLVMCVIPYLLTGFMHLDGFMDVTDAIGSWRELEKRRMILKDSHVGSFAVIRSTFLILAGFAVFSSVSKEVSIWLLALIPMISRCCSALAIINLKPMNTSQYAGNSTYPKWHTIILVCGIVISVASAAFFSGKDSVSLLAGLVAYGIALKKSCTSLQGMNGDISGYCICISELCAVTVLVL